MENKKDIDNINNIKILIDLLKNNKSIFVCINCRNINSYETYNNILQFIKVYLNIHFCVIDIISIYNSENIPKLLKDIFLEFIKYIKRNRIYKSVFILPYFDEWIIPIKQRKNANLGEEYNEEKIKRKDINMHIYNAICYLKNSLLKNLNKKYCVKFIGFHKTNDIFDLYSDFFDYKINVLHFINTHILYYININKSIKLCYKENNLSINSIYKILNDRLDFINSEIDLFKCFFKYYYKFYNFRKNKEKQEKRKLEFEKIKRNKVEKYIFAEKNFNLINILVSLNNFKCLKKYKYILTEKKKKKFCIFLYNCNVNNVLKLLCKNYYTPFFIKEYVNTLLKRHIKLTKNFNYSKKNNKIYRTNNGKVVSNINNYRIKNSTNINKHYSRNNNSTINGSSDNINTNKFIGQRSLKLNHKNTIKYMKFSKLLKIRKHFILKNDYQNDQYNIYNSDKKNYISFYFSKINVPNTLLIYGKNGVGKSTLIKFIIHIIFSNYKSLFIDKRKICKNNNIKKEYIHKSIQNISINKDSYNSNHINNNKFSKYYSQIKKIHLIEKKKIFYKFKNVWIIPFENHLLINKTIGENSKYIKKIFLTALKNQPSVIIFDNIDLFLEKNKYYKGLEDDQNEDVYKNIYILLIHYLSIYLNKSNKIKFIATTSINPYFFKFSFLNKIKKIIFIS
ncbi:conserved Plasmodium protein, unknown function [Plasmodium relictum]|uniref:AAA+ ATPase domain-containing protein n=1 Tax=Plasmodium relictum TaxID=85471 RepID=A0A1J1H927_PLARL|nr:conserved Plasmodium protein, unknown function [Plasmodium relictum]CRH01295.1 conserved Plasmodium protein, unknown function [Plasmodium relictum]